MPPLRGCAPRTRRSTAEQILDIQRQLESLPIEQATPILPRLPSPSPSPAPSFSDAFIFFSAATLKRLKNIEKSTIFFRFSDCQSGLVAQRPDGAFCITRASLRHCHLDGCGGAIDR